MKFKDCLRRYHIFPLQYEDGTELEENDYVELHKMLVNYTLVDEMLSHKSRFTYVPDEKLVDKVNFLKNNSVLEFDGFEALDVLNGFENDSIIINE